MGTTNNLPVGLIDSSILSVQEAASYLSAAELEQYSAIRHDRRRTEWLSGRVAAKFVFLHRAEIGAPINSTLSLLRLDPETLRRFSQQDYRQAVVQSHPSPGGGSARIGFAGDSSPVKVAITHGNGLACAFIGTTGDYAVDLEKRSPRVSEFYAQNFSWRETEWTCACADSLGLEREWLYTLLWSTKECLLKTPDFRDFSLWNMPAIEIQVLTGSERLKPFHDAAEFSSTFEILDARASRSGLIQVAVSGTADFVVTAITNLDSVTEGYA
jgi:hypothetical protein